MEVYVLRYEDCTNNQYHSQTLGVYNSIEAARDAMKELRDDDLNNYFDNGYGDCETIEELAHLLVEESEDEVTFDFANDYTTYVVEKFPVKGGE